eukprot:CAMPEP_0172165454 /NCGR_PEP_ID=MMETSP1050-20130122/8422_1 /TAXON_ID=233186 /ORGANISM="Cryptomonas curvata, Strain CCAP979/52" /LENGTH=199 /DNA_ID=CAMNT_0012835929 /DNA_START=16 /DNA_END=612 /DNA_ORIENTATION=+
MSSHSEQSDGSARSKASSYNVHTRRQAPSREGYIEFFEEVRSIVTQVPWLGQAPWLKREPEFTRRWIIIRDCWMYSLENEKDKANVGEQVAGHTYDLRGSVCEPDAVYERTLRVETQAISLFASDMRSRHVLFLRVQSEHEIRLWKESIDCSSMWDVVLRAWAFQDASAEAAEAASAAIGIDSAVDLALADGDALVPAF